MKQKLSVAISLFVLMALMLTSVASAQYTGFSWSTSYSVVNMGTDVADITIKYYDEAGAESSYSKTYTDVPVGASRTVVQFDETALGTGRYSAVVTANQPVAATVNQQLVENTATSFSSKPPFSSYSGQGTGGTTVTLPQVEHNWYGYYTDVFIMNVGSGDAADVDIVYTPSNIGGVVSGATGQKLENQPIKQYASLLVSQKDTTSLGAASGTFAGRFFGSATITADQPVIAVVNQHNTTAKKLLTYNGFTPDAIGSNVALPQHMKNWYGYYGSLLIANPGTAPVEVTLTYTPDPNLLPGKTAVVATHTIAPQTGLNRYDGPGASSAQSDLGSFERFVGSVSIVSEGGDVVVQENLEAVSPGPAQGGAYNGMPVDTATKTIVVPLIQADFYGLYTSLTVQNVTNTAGTCTIKYTSDNLYSSVKDTSKEYTHEISAGGSFNVYEGHGANGQTNIGDINTDEAWRVGSGPRDRLFIGSATITCSVEVVAFVNSEQDIANADSMYTFNTFNK